MGYKELGNMQEEVGLERIIDVWSEQFVCVFI